MKFSKPALTALCLAAFWTVQAGAWADTPTFTPTSTQTASPSATQTPSFSASPTITVSPTATPSAQAGAGEGSYTTNPDTLITGTQNNTLVLSYVTGADGVSSTGGVVNFTFPYGFGVPSQNSFYLSPTNTAQPRLSYSYSGLDVTVRILDPLAPYTSLMFWYGFNPGGFTLSAVTPTASFLVSSNAFSTDPSSAYALAVQPTIAIIAPTPTITPTFSASPTISPTFTISPTSTNTPTVTPTFTETPLGPSISSGCYSYPNPFDLRDYDKVTFRFPPDTNVHLQVYNLVGEPVATLPGSAIQDQQGWAVWNGRDDYGRQVSGGLYFYRVKGDNHTWVGKFTVLH